MTTSPEQMSFLAEILEWKPIPKDKLIYFRERLRDRLHSAILNAFLTRSKERGLKQKDLALRIHRTEPQITRWLSTTSNLTLDSISDLMVGLGMDFDAFPFTPIEKTVDPSKERTQGWADVRSRQGILNRLESEWARLSKSQLRPFPVEQTLATAGANLAPSVYIAAASEAAESIPKVANVHKATVTDFTAFAQKRAAQPRVLESQDRLLRVGGA